MSGDAALTELLALAAQGDRSAMDQVVAALYPELRRIAHARLRSYGSGAPVQTTALLHESYLRLAQVKSLSLADRKHFLTYAAKVMRHVLIDLARERDAQRRGGGVEALPLDLESMQPLADDEPQNLLRVHDALLALEDADAGLARIVEMRYFGGYSDAEIAELVGSSVRTVRRQWDKARAYLLVALKDG
jgi:RNA polymerase sigma factor (TIGR02999 family)